MKAAQKLYALSFDAHFDAFQALELAFKYSMWNHQVEGSLLVYTDDGKVYTQRLGE
jgi:hypothetical protein